MKVAIEVTMTSGNQYRLIRSCDKQGCSIDEISANFEKELAENVFISHNSGTRLRVANIESYKHILSSND